MKTRTGANRIVRLGSFARAGALAAALGVASCGADADWSAGDEELGAIEEELVGGTLTSERPAIGMFAFRGSTLCSATLVEPSYVATAAHCVDSFSGPD